MKVHQRAIYAVGIGPGKAGTTWLYNQLSRHSEISTCKIKEPYFFTENFKYGFKWYKSLFSQNRPVRLEISNRYIFEFEEFNGNLKKFDENILIIYFDRDPFDRARSAFLFEKQMGQVLTVEEFFDYNKVMEFSTKRLNQRVEILEKNFEVFRVDFARLKDKPQELIDDLCDKLNINTIEYFENAQKNTSLQPRSQFLSALSKQIALLLRKVHLFKLLQILKQNSFIRSILFKRKLAELKKDEHNKILELIKNINADQ